MKTFFTLPYCGPGAGHHGRAGRGERLSRAGRPRRAANSEDSSSSWLSKLVADADCNSCDPVDLMASGQYATAMTIFQRRAASGDSVAMNNIGLIYQNGLGVAADYRRR